MRAVTVLGVQHHILVFLDHFDDVQLDAELFRRPQRVVAFGSRGILFANRVRVALNAKTGVEIDAFDVNALSPRSTS